MMLIALPMVVVRTKRVEVKLLLRDSIQTETMRQHAFFFKKKRCSGIEKNNEKNFTCIFMFRLFCNISLLT